MVVTIMRAVPWYQLEARSSAVCTREENKRCQEETAASYR